MGGAARELINNGADRPVVTEPTTSIEAWEREAERWELARLWVVGQVFKGCVERLLGLPLREVDLWGGALEGGER